jgi:hypothetical protein
VSLLEKYIASADPMHFGLSARGVANGLGLTFGFSFPRIAGGYNLYRGLDSVDAIDWVNPVGAASADANEVRSFAWMGHNANTRYVYGVRAIGGGGVEETETHNVVRAAFDAGGALRPPEPNAPVGLTVSPAAGGAVRVEWAYSSAGQDAAPAAFDVYDNGGAPPPGSGAGAVDFLNAAIGSVAYKPGRVFHSFQTGSYGHGTRVELAVRARSESGAVEANTVTRVVIAVATPPTGFAGLVVTEGGES